MLLKYFKYFGQFGFMILEFKGLCPPNMFFFVLAASIFFAKPMTFSFYSSQHPHLVSVFFHCTQVICCVRVLYGVLWFCNGDFSFSLTCNHQPYWHSAGLCCAGLHLINSITVGKVDKQLFY